MNNAVYDKLHIKNSMFGRDVLHCIESFNFNPWSCMERYPIGEAQPGNMDMYLIYATGQNYALNQAKIKLEYAIYNNGDRRGDVESRFQTIYNEYLELPTPSGTYEKKKIATFEMPNHGYSAHSGAFVGWRLTVDA